MFAINIFEYIFTDQTTFVHMSYEIWWNLTVYPPLNAAGLNCVWMVFNVIYYSNTDCDAPSTVLWYCFEVQPAFVFVVFEKLMHIHCAFGVLRMNTLLTSWGYSIHPLFIASASFDSGRLYIKLLQQMYRVWVAIYGDGDFAHKKEAAIYVRGLVHLGGTAVMTQWFFAIPCLCTGRYHYDDVIMDAIASQITSLASVYSDV